MSTSTIAIKFSAFMADIGYMLGFSVSIILGVLAALLGLGWAVVKLKQYITGNGQWYDQPDAMYRRGIRNAIRHAYRREYGP